MKKIGLISAALALFAAAALAATTVNIPLQVTVAPTGTTVVVAGQTTVIPMACGAAPASTVATIACPAGTTGSWKQTTNYVSTAAPTCWSPLLSPVAAPAGSCTAVVTPPPPPPVTGAPCSPNAVVMSAGVFFWNTNFNYGGLKETDNPPPKTTPPTPAPTFNGQPATLMTATALPSGGGGWLPVFNAPFFNTTGCKFLSLTLAPTRAGQSWQLVQPELPQNGVNDTPVPGGATVTVENYGPKPMPNVAATYKIPLSVIAPNGTLVWKFGVQDQMFWANGQGAAATALGAGNTWYVLDARFTAN